MSKAKAIDLASIFIIITMKTYIVHLLQKDTLQKKDTLQQKGALVNE